MSHTRTARPIKCVEHDAPLRLQNPETASCDAGCVVDAEEITATGSPVFITDAAGALYVPAEANIRQDPTVPTRVRVAALLRSLRVGDAVTVTIDGRDHAMRISRAYQLADLTFGDPLGGNVVASYGTGRYSVTVGVDALVTGRITLTRREGVPRETQWLRRGHPFYPPAELAVTIPALYATENVPCAAKTIHLHYFAGGCDWWLAEYDPATGRGFGYVCLGDPQCAEWGYVDLAELEEVSVARGLVIVERDLHWTPTRAGEIDLPGWRAR